MKNFHFCLALPSFFEILNIRLKTLSLIIMLFIKVLRHLIVIQKLVKLQSKNILDLPSLSIAKYLNEIELFTFANIYLVFCLSRSYAKFI